MCDLCEISLQFIFSHGTVILDVVLEVLHKGKRDLLPKIEAKTFPSCSAFLLLNVSNQKLSKERFLQCNKGCHYFAANVLLPPGEVYIIPYILCVHENVLHTHMSTHTFSIRKKQVYFTSQSFIQRECPDIVYLLYKVLGYLRLKKRLKILRHVNVYGLIKENDFNYYHVIAFKFNKIIDNKAVNLLSCHRYENTIFDTPY